MDIINSLNSKLTNQNYSSINNIPWLFNNPDYYLLYWQAKCNELLKSYYFKITSLQYQITQTKYTETKNRLEKLILAYEFNQKQIEKLLLPLFNKAPTELNAFSDLIPSQQTLALYLNNIFRDWSWGTQENENYIEAISKALGNQWHTDEILILGSGSSRLSMDFHLKYKPKFTFALDFNPLLLFIAQKMLSHEDFKLFEIPFPVIEKENISKKWTLHNTILENQLSKQHFQLIFGDIQNLPFKSESFSCVLTPWVIDILPMDFEKLAERVNNLLPIDGEWINFGPLGFMHSKESICHTRSEIVEVLESKGFEVEINTTQAINYLNSPVSSQKRIEEVLIFKARKKKSVPVSTYSYLPAWLLNRDLPIPLNDQIQNQKILAKTTADIFFSIDNQQSFNSLSQLLANHYKMPIEQAQQTLMLLLIKFHESQSRSLK